MAELKPFKTIDEQIDHLIHFHGLMIEDREKAKGYLSHVNYYRLVNGYGVGLMKPDNHDRFQDGVTLRQLYDLHRFDSHFRNLFLHVIEQVEIQLRTQISYYLGGKYGALGYMDAANFITKYNKDGENIHSVIIQHFKKECERQKKAPMVKHHNEKYNGIFPVWVAVELFTFGNLSSLYSIMQDEDRKAIASLYRTEPSHLQSWMLTFVEIRNICAHYGRLYNMPLKQTPFLYREYKYLTKKRTIPKVFPAVLALKRTLDSDARWLNFLISLEALLDEYRDVVNLSYIGFPSNWKQLFEDYYRC